MLGRHSHRAKPHGGNEPSELAAALKACRSAFVGIGVMSAMINVLYLTGSFFMLEVYDRVVPSRSVPTLVGLVILAAFLYTAQGVLDLIRGRILVRIGASLDESLGARVFDTVARLPLKVGQRNDGMQPIRDLDSIRSFLGGLGPIAHVRSALDAVLHRHLLRLPSADRHHRARRRDHPHRGDAHHRMSSPASRSRKRPASRSRATRSPTPAAATPRR